VAARDGCGVTYPVDDLSAASGLEARIHEDETRLAYDELRLLEDEQRMRSNRRLTIGLGVALAIAVAGLIVALVALRQDVSALSTAAPQDSVNSAAINDGAVTSDKLATKSVTAAALARGAVTEPAVTADSLTGASIRESSLERVPSARRASDSRALAGLPATSYVSRLRTVRAETPLDSTGVKGPLSASCPGGFRVLSGGAAVEGVPYGIAIATSAPRNGDEWVAVARRYHRSRHVWRLVVTAICSRGGH
jgi:hypothetical protein